MKLVKYNDIDPEKWNACIARVSKSVFYGLYEYLSAICDWEAIIEEEDGIYLFVVPLPFKSKLLLKYIYQPFFCQQLGVFGVGELSVEQECEVFKIIKKNFVMCSFNWSFAPRESSFLQVDQQPNYVLNLDKSWEEIEKGFNSNRKRTLKKSKKIETTISLESDGESINKTIDNFKNTLGERFTEIKTAHYKSLKEGFSAIKEVSKVQVFNLSVERKIVASVLIVEFNNRLTYMLGYVDDECRKSGINSLLFEEIIKRNVLSNKILDFEGGKSSGIAQFYSSFGAAESFYYGLIIQTKMNEMLKIVR